MNEPRAMSLVTMTVLALVAVLADPLPAAAQTVMVAPAPVIWLPPPPAVGAFHAAAFSGAPVVTMWTGPYVFSGHIQPEPPQAASYFTIPLPDPQEPISARAASVTVWSRLRGALRNLACAVSDYAIKPILRFASNLWNRIRPPSQRRFDRAHLQKGRGPGGRGPLGPFYPWWTPLAPPPQPWPCMVFDPDCYPTGGRTACPASRERDGEDGHGAEPPVRPAEDRPAASRRVDSSPRSTSTITSTIVEFLPSGELPAWVSALRRQGAGAGAATPATAPTSRIVGLVSSREAQASGRDLARLLANAALRAAQMYRYPIWAPLPASRPRCFCFACGFLW